MKLIPLISEKSTKLVSGGGFTFWVDKNVTKSEIKRAVDEAFGVHVTSVRTANYKAGKKRTIRGQIRQIKAAKKAIVHLTGDEKIDLFIEEKKAKKAKKGSK